MKKWLKLLLWGLGVCLIAGAFLYITRNFWLEQYYKYEIRRIELEVDQYGPFLPEVDEVEVILLGGLTKTAEHDGFMEGRISDYNILGQKAVRDKDAKDIADMWRFLPRNPLYSDMCHSPIYALRFRDHGKPVFETTIWWHCNNYTITVPGHDPEDGEWGFDANSKAATMLLDKLKQVVPFPPEPPHK
jgi:hypothetical protein